MLYFANPFKDVTRCYMTMIAGFMESEKSDSYEDENRWEPCLYSREAGPLQSLDKHGPSKTQPLRAS